MNLESLYPPHPGMTIDQLIEMRRNEPPLIRYWRRHVHRTMKIRRLAAQGIQIVNGKKTPIQNGDPS